MIHLSITSGTVSKAIPDIWNHRNMLFHMRRDFSKNSTKQVKVRDYEKQIDQLVYKLYGLTPQEIKIVENS